MKGRCLPGPAAYSQPDHARAPRGQVPLPERSHPDLRLSSRGYPQAALQNGSDGDNDSTVDDGPIDSKPLAGVATEILQEAPRPLKVSESRCKGLHGRQRAQHAHAGHPRHVQAIPGAICSARFWSQTCELGCYAQSGASKLTAVAEMLGEVDVFRVLPGALQSASALHWTQRTCLCQAPRLKASENCGVVLTRKSPCQCHPDAKDGKPNLEF